MILILLGLLTSTGSAEPLTERVENAYVRPALAQIQEALEGRGPSWVPPVLPGTSQTRLLNEELQRLWLEPLLQGGDGSAHEAARRLASPTDFSPPPQEASLAERLPIRSLSPVAADMAARIEENFLKQILPGEYFHASARALGSSELNEGPSAPRHEGLSPMAGEAAQAAPRPSGKDSTKMVRGKADFARPRLKPLKSKFSAVR